MIRRLASDDISRFESICADLASPFSEAGETIGTFNEKRIHRAIKRFITEDETCYEIKVGSSVADVVFGGIIHEIQTGSFFPLTKKIAAYLANSENEVRVIYPVATKNTVVRLDTSTGEVLRKRAMNTKKGVLSILPELIYLSDFLKNPRLCFDIYLIETEERRYSDNVYRYRKKGRRDSETFPVTLSGIVSLETTDDFAALLPNAVVEKSALGGFTAADFSAASGLRGRSAYLALGALCSAGVLEKEKDGRNAAVFRFV